MDLIKGKKFDEERALYNIKDTRVEDCIFAGEADGESAFKEAKNIEVASCEMRLRYPLWHVSNFLFENSKMYDTCRAAIWYAENGKIVNSVLGGIKCLRECKNILISGCEVNSLEFGWKCENINIEKSKLTSEYIFFGTKGGKLNDFEMKGKYSFQYTENLVIENAELDTKDAFWHSKNVTVKNSVIKGEYLAWYSENLTLIGCKLIGTQPLCYCKGLKLIDCTMENTDLSFEYSEVDATIKGSVMSVKNPISGKIVADEIDEILLTDDAIYPCECKIEIRK